MKKQTERCVWPCTHYATLTSTSWIIPPPTRQPRCILGYAWSWSCRNSMPTCARLVFSLFLPFSFFLLPGVRAEPSLWEEHVVAYSEWGNVWEAAAARVCYYFGWHHLARSFHIGWNTKLHRSKSRHSMSISCRTAVSIPSSYIMA